MTSSTGDLKDLMEDVVAQPAAAIHVDATAAWREGRRRRKTSRVTVAGLVVAVVVGTVLALTAGPPVLPSEVLPAKGSGRVVDEHPQRLDYAYWSRALPKVTGPLAGVVGRDSGGWYAVSPSGQEWRVNTTDGDAPTLSPDGVHLGYMYGPYLEATYRIVDQVAGTVVRFPEISIGAFDGRTEDFDHDHRYFHSEQSPAFWSPDGTAVLLQIGLNDSHGTEREPAAAVLGTDGSLVTIPMPDGSHAPHPVGWTDDHHVVLLDQGGSNLTRVKVSVIDIQSGRVARTFVLSGGSGRQEIDQWFGTVSPDGNELATVNAPEDGKIQFFSMRAPTQGQLTATLPGWSAAEGCQQSWSSSDFYLPNDTTIGSESAILGRANGGATILADPRLHVVCSFWARGALDGRGHTNLSSLIFGSNTNWLSWHWREVVGAILLAIALSLGARLILKRRMRRLPR